MYCMCIVGASSIMWFMWWTYLHTTWSIKPLVLIIKAFSMRIFKYSSVVKRSLHITSLKAYRKFSTIRKMGFGYGMRICGEGFSSTKLAHHGKYLASGETAEEWKQTKRLRRNTLNREGGQTDMFSVSNIDSNHNPPPPPSQLTIPRQQRNDIEERLRSSENTIWIYIIIFSRLNFFGDVSCSWKVIGRGWVAAGLRGQNNLLAKGPSPAGPMFPFPSPFCSSCMSYISKFAATVY